MYWCICVCVRLYVCICVYVCTCVYTCTCVCIPVHLCACVKGAGRSEFLSPNQWEVFSISFGWVIHLAHRSLLQVLQWRARFVYNNINYQVALQTGAPHRLVGIFGGPYNHAAQRSARPFRKTVSAEISDDDRSGGGRGGVIDIRAIATKFHGFGPPGLSFHLTFWTDNTWFFGLIIVPNVQLYTPVPV